jgi:hypothetical protein
MNASYFLSPRIEFHPSATISAKPSTLILTLFLAGTLASCAKHSGPPNTNAPQAALSGSGRQAAKAPETGPEHIAPSCAHAQCSAAEILAMFDRPMNVADLVRNLKLAFDGDLMLQPAFFERESLVKFFNAVTVSREEIPANRLPRGYGSQVGTHIAVSLPAMMGDGVPNLQQRSERVPQMDPSGVLIIQAICAIVMPAVSHSLTRRACQSAASRRVAC